MQIDFPETTGPRVFPHPRDTEFGVIITPMNKDDRILPGRVTFSTDGFFVQFEDSGRFIDLSGDAVVQPDFNENTFNRQRVSVVGHMGTRSIMGEPDASPRVDSFIAKRIVLQKDIAVRAFEIFQSRSGGSTLDNWLRAERELLSSAPAAKSTRSGGS